MTTTTQPSLVQSNTGAISSILGMVSTIANTVTSTANAIGGGATMANNYVAKAQADQADAHKIHRKVYRSNLVTRAALQQTQLELEVQAHVQSNPAIAESFTKVHKDLSDLFAEA